MDPRARAHPLASFVQSVRLRGGQAVGWTYISGGAWDGSPFVKLTERLRGDSGGGFTKYRLGITSRGGIRSVLRVFLVRWLGMDKERTLYTGKLRQ